MPTSTPWRNRRSDDENREASPARPSIENIERLSPVPFLSAFTTQDDSIDQFARDQQLFGLGLSDTSNANGSFSLAQPDHLYFDSDGGAHVAAKPRSKRKNPYTSDNRSRDGRNGTSRSNKLGSRQSKLRGHTRSGSTIDDLANIAIATSPSLDNDNTAFFMDGSHSELSNFRPATSYMDGYSSNSRSSGRPTKRVRSEKLYQSEWSPRDERPRTSHAISPQTSREEAELLLGLRNGYSFSTNTSPVFAPASTFQPPTTLDAVQLPLAEALINQLSSTHTVEGDKVTHEEEDTMKTITRPNQELEVTKQDEMEIDKPHYKPQVEASESSQKTEGAPAETKTTVDDTPSTTLDQSAEVAAEAPAIPTKKKPRKIKPEIQAEVCAACQKLQRDNNGDDATTQWICCDYCSKWFHLACGGFKDKSETRAVDKYVCKDCEPQHGQTTFVRKSSRVRTAIDYAGLNEGLVKSSEETTTHHYIQPIKNGTLKILPDDFARVRPELLTAEFWENMDNMKRPFVVPACWNPRFGLPREAEDHEQDRIEAEPSANPSYVTYDSHGNSIEQIPSSKNESTTNEIDDTTELAVLDCDQDYLDMVMPRNLTVRKVAELYGPEQPVPVIDVKSQETKGQWTLNDWANYYEQKGEKPIRNVISLEVSNSPIGKLIRRPKAVRDIDLEDYVWDNETRSSSNKRPVQFYCLMSVADSYTDFHIDFGGSSVYYHILKGVKTFFFIPPEEKNLKEYEKWCNSDTQNDTWLGDLCNGNVTRVDLHEGDTAFIPAGWIHSVWTPEDSLVIGGNFLTRLDYELQLRVANVERVTRVPQKFRYPFFQKVMWYALLKYLEDDPVPEEVLKDFHADEDYRFLRANPVWHEYGDLASDAEPGEPGYNARMYPKSEVNGLAALRDYLYRTACIHADIPVPDINKRQIDAVKASIPKGHGDPMRLIKTFAVWCAWKSGNEAVPRWVHDQGDGLSTEIKEREKAKEETFRVPPERVSARNASKARAPSPVVEAVATPSKTITQADGNDASSTKSRSGSRGGSLRIACDACRKRRIKCRHKEGDDAATNSSPPEIRPRTYSNVSVDIPKLASASPVSSAFDQTTTMNGMLSDFSATSDLAQAALATLHSQSSDPNPAGPTTPNGGSAKKGRSKACEECRKSKRRCVHDEYGRIDPAKAAEPSKPRGSTSTKRQSRPSEEYSTKRLKLESDIEHQIADIEHITDIDSMIDPALMDDAFSFNAIHPPTETIVTHHEADTEAHHSYIPPLPSLPVNTDPIHNEDLQMSSNEEGQDNQIAAEGVMPRLRLAVNEGAVAGPSYLPAHMRYSPDMDISYSPITVDGTITDTTDKLDEKMEDTDAQVTSGPRHSPRQPKQTERYVPGSHQSPTKVGSKSGAERGASSSSEHTLEVSIKSRRSSSNTSGTTHQAAAATQTKQIQSQEVSARATSRASSADSDMDADEKLARELQAAENGLRRRASMRA